MQIYVLGLGKGPSLLTMTKEESGDQYLPETFFSNKNSFPFESYKRLKFSFIRLYRANNVKVCIL